MLANLGLAARVSHLWSDLRGSLWFVPGLMAVGAMSLALVMLHADGWAPDWILDSAWLYSRSAGGARVLLSTVASSMITIAGLTFSILVVALQLASSQFGPRVLRNYMRDRGSQIALGTFIATFLYCLLVMRSIGDIDVEEPRVAVTLAVLLAIASLAVLIYFLHHSAASIHAPNVITAVAQELHSTIDRLYPASVGQPAAGVTAPARERTNETLIAAKKDGYVQRVDGNALLALADEHHIVVHVLRRPGDFVHAGQPLAAAVPIAARPDAIASGVHSAYILGSNRTAEQDVEFCFEQLVQIALRALSPAYNDPLTAAACIERLGAAFDRLLSRQEPPAVRVSADGSPRVVAPPVSGARLIDLVLAPLIESASGSSIVLRQLAATLAGLASSPRTREAQDALTASVQLVMEHLDTIRAPRTRHEIRECCQHALSELNHAPRPL